MGGWSPTEKIYQLNKRRRWIRNRSIIKRVHSIQNLNKVFLNSLSPFLLIFENWIDIWKKNELEEASKEGWEYSKLFSTKFHAKENSSDMVRRRRWHRPMQPKNSKTSLTALFHFEQNQVVDFDLLIILFMKFNIF